MFYENRAPQRSGWKFTYTAKELLPYVEKALQEHTEGERKCRDMAATLMRDNKVLHNDPRHARLSGAIEQHGDAIELMTVLAHEFKRVPEKEYTLAIADVVFLEIAGKAASPFEEGNVDMDVATGSVSSTFTYPRPAR